MVDMDEYFKREMASSALKKRVADAKRLSGGVRSGRPPLAESGRERTVLHACTITPSDGEAIRELGNGNFSAGVRMLLAEHRSHTGEDLA